MYSQYGHELVNQPVSVAGKKTGAGIGILRLRRAIGNHLSQLTGSSTTGRSFAHNKADLEHYREFAKSPVNAYRQVVAELPHANSSINDLKELTESVFSSNTPDRWNQALTQAADVSPIDVSGEVKTGLKEYVRKLLRLKSVQRQPTVADFSSYIQDIKRLGGFDESSSADAIKDGVRRAFSQFSSTENGKPISLAAHVHDRIDQVVNAYGRGGDSAVMGRLMEENSPLQKYTNTLITERMKMAPKNYTAIYSLANALRRAGSPGAVVASGLLGTGALLSRYLPGQDKEAADERNDYFRDAVIGAGVTGGSYLYASPHLNNLSEYGLRSVNPLAKPTVNVLGGTQGGGSFSSQAKAWAEALKDHGIDTERVTNYDAQYYTPNNNKMNQLLNRDAVLQVGATPFESDMHTRVADGSMLRYRALTDIGDGNFNQPEQWLEGRNWMKVHDSPSSYSRMFVPGGDVSPLPEQYASRLGNVNLPSIPTNKLFHGKEFVSDKAIAGARAAITMGGGAGGFLLFRDLQEPTADGGHRYSSSKKNILDNIQEALRKKHGDDFGVDMYVGGKVDDIKKSYPAFGDFVQSIYDDKTDRYKNIRLHSLVPQEDIAKVYSNADYLFQLPGSTTAELAAMKGNPGKVINLVPDENPDWMPKHFSSNAKFNEKIMPGATSIDLADSDNMLSRISKAVMEGRESMGESPNRVADVSDAAKAIKSDIFKLKLKRLGKLGLPLAGMAGGVSLLGNAIYGQANAQASRPEQRSDIASKLISHIRSGRIAKTD